jgi:hypothetical protein
MCVFLLQDGLSFSCFERGLRAIIFGFVTRTLSTLICFRDAGRAARAGLYREPVVRFMGVPDVTILMFTGVLIGRCCSYKGILAAKRELPGL